MQPFNQNKLVSSIAKAGATQPQATLVANRVVNRIGDKPTVTTTQLSSMVTRSLSKVNTTAASQYMAYRDQKTSSATQSGSIVARQKNPISAITPLGLALSRRSARSPPSKTEPAGTVTSSQARTISVEDYCLMLADEIFRLINEERNANNLPILVYDQKLAGVALEWARQCAQTGYYSHGDYVGRIRQTGLSGIPMELMALTGNPSELNAQTAASHARSIVDMWLNSTQGHYQIMTTPKGGFMGVGNAMGSMYTIIDFVFSN